MGEVRDREREEINMNRAEQERRDVGLSPEEVRKINRSRSLQGDAFKKALKKRAANVLAAGITVAAGVGLAGTAQEALKSVPPAVVQEQKPDPKRDIPPEGVVFPENTQADGSTSSPQSAPVEPFLRKRVFIPRVLKEVSQEALDAAERPLWPERFGNIEVDKVEFINLVTKAGVVIRDETLYRNLLWIRDNYAQYPDIKRKFYFYDGIVRLRLSGVDRDRIKVAWRTSYPNPPFGWGEVWAIRNLDGSLDFHIVLPIPEEGKEVSIENFKFGNLRLLQAIDNGLFSNEDGRPAPDRNGEAGIRRGSQKEKDYKDHPIFYPPIIGGPDYGAVVRIFALELKYK